MLAALMHPNPAFHWDDREALRELVRQIGFGMLCVATPEGPRVAHVPAIWLTDDALGMHLARANALAPSIDGATALFAVQGPHGYVSPDWYCIGPDEVPTWNYIAAELEGRMTRMDRAALTAQVDALSRDQESRLAPKPAWTRAKADAGKIDRMFDAIVGFRFDVVAWRGTRKLNQNKPEAARRAVADALEGQGQAELADWMRRP